MAAEKVAAVIGSSALQQCDDKTFTLVSSDGQRFPIALAALSTSIVPTSERGRGIMLLNISGEPLAKIVEYLTKHAAPTGSTDHDGGGGDETPTSEWEEKFIDVGNGLLYDILVAADDLNIDGLVDLASHRVAGLIKGKVPGEIRAMFGIDDDFTPEQRAGIRRDNPWI